MGKCSAANHEGGVGEKTNMLTKSGCYVLTYYSKKKSVNVMEFSDSNKETLKTK